MRFSKKIYTKRLKISKSQILRYYYMYTASAAIKYQISNKKYHLPRVMGRKHEDKNVHKIIARIVEEIQRKL